MIGSRLMSLLQTFDRQEQKQFQKFLASPIHNQREEVGDFYKVILNISHDEDLGKEKVWDSLHPTKSYQDSRMRHVMSELLHLANDFLAWQSFASDRDRKALETARQYRKRNLEELLVAACKKRDKGLDKRLHRVENALLDYEWAQLQVGLGLGFGRKEQDDISRHFHGLDEWIALQKLRQATSYLSHQRLFNLSEPPKIHYWPDLEDEISIGRLQENPIFVLFHAAYQLVEHQSESSFQYLQQLLQEHEPGIHPIELRTLYLIAINFCVKQLNFGNRDYLEILFDIYWNGLETKWIFEKGILSPWTYKNIVSVGLKLARYYQIVRFISQYREMLPISHREDFYQHAQAELLFAKADYLQVLRTTNHVQLKDAITRIRVRIIRIKACYELREISLLEYQVENLTQLLRREKRSAYHKQHYLDFAAHISRLIRILPNATEAIQAFSQQLDLSEAYLERKWLKDKLDELATWSTKA